MEIVNTKTISGVLFPAFGTVCPKCGTVHRAVITNVAINFDIQLKAEVKSETSRIIPIGEGQWRHQ